MNELVKILAKLLSEGNITIDEFNRFYDEIQPNTTITFGPYQSIVWDGIYPPYHVTCAGDN